MKNEENAVCYRDSSALIKLLAAAGTRSTDHSLSNVVFGCLPELYDTARLVVFIITYHLSGDGRETASSLEGLDASSSDSDVHVTHNLDRVMSHRSPLIILLS